jgi:riboflavin kinase/FMN adenylyltransferase
MLGRPYAVSGKVVRGDQLGRTIGFPTANIETGKVQLPPNGVWAVRVSDSVGNLRPGVANLGVRPTVGGGKRLLEVHLFDFIGELYDHLLDVRFENFLRPEMKFNSVEALRNQIENDALAARAYLAEHPA